MEIQFYSNFTSTRWIQELNSQIVKIAQTQESAHVTYTYLTQIAALRLTKSRPDWPYK